MTDPRFKEYTEFLRGLGVTMALPWMESLIVWGDEAKAVVAGSQAPVRLAVFFSGNGFHSKEWWAKGEGEQMALGQDWVAELRRRMPVYGWTIATREERVKAQVHADALIWEADGRPRI